MKSFNNIEDAIKHIQSKIEKTIGQAASQLSENIINRTPVLTGALSANWNTTLGNPDYNFDKEVTSNSHALAQLRQVEQQFKINDTVYITNGADYSEIIEYGNYSNKAPNGMVRVSLLNFQNILDRKAKDNDL